MVELQKRNWFWVLSYTYAHHSSRTTVDSEFPPWPPCHDDTVHETVFLLLSVCRSRESLHFTVLLDGQYLIAKSLVPGGHLVALPNTTAALPRRSGRSAASFFRLKVDSDSRIYTLLGRDGERLTQWRRPRLD